MNANKPKFIAEYPLSKILRLIPRCGQPFSKDVTHTFVAGKKKCLVNLSSETLKLVAQQPVCINCGIKASKIRLFKDARESKYFIEIFVDSPAGLYKLTKDHIVPKSKGGTDSFKNYQVMCEKCNQEKSDQHLYFQSDYWYVRWPNVSWAEGPYKLPFKTKSISKVRSHIRKYYQFTKLPAGLECWPSKGYHLIL